MVEAVGEDQPLVEIGLRLGRVGGDLEAMIAEPVEERHGGIVGDRESMGVIVAMSMGLVGEAASGKAGKGKRGHGDGCVEMGEGFRNRYAHGCLL
jgi:hypothetical protein